jgi:hypothetical protein
MTSDNSFETTIAEIVDELRELREPRLCAWGGCAARYDGEKPPDWASLTISCPRKTQEAVLCPKHADQLDGILRDCAGRSATGWPTFEMRRSMPPWSADRIPGGYVVKDATVSATGGGSPA